MKNVLIVDDETPVQLTISQGLGIYTKNLNVLTAENGKNAMEVMESFNTDFHRVFKRHFSYGVQIILRGL
jgi:CheY-like chemotaxis protein